MAKAPKVYCHPDRQADSKQPKTSTDVLCSFPLGVKVSWNPTYLVSQCSQGCNGSSIGAERIAMNLNDYIICCWALNSGLHLHWASQHFLTLPNPQHPFFLFWLSLFLGNIISLCSTGRTWIPDSPASTSQHLECKCVPMCQRYLGFCSATQADCELMIFSLEWLWLQT